MTGLWGITFLVTWLGSTVAWVAQRGWSTEALPVLLVYAIAWTVVMLFGGLRLAFGQPAWRPCAWRPLAGVTISST
ncbi:MAG TPA: hypothetical protein VGW38_15705 [Chloroflexota bacterium]|nr:hypothetical protein [Chloroflexota bacterium]